MTTQKNTPADGDKGTDKKKKRQNASEPAEVSTQGDYHGSSEPANVSVQGDYHGSSEPTD